MMSDEVRDCPKCGKSWVVREMDEEEKKVFAGTFFSQLIGIETEDYDGISEWQCPFCKTRWSRWTGKEL